MVANTNELIFQVEQKYIRKDLPTFEVGDTIRMRIRVQEGEKSRLHPFEGIVIAKKGKGHNGTFIVRKVSFGEGVERIFPINSPSIESLKVVSRGIIKRAKLYHLREQIGKKSHIKQEQVKPEQVPSQAQAPTTPIADASV